MQWFGKQSRGPAPNTDTPTQSKFTERARSALNLSKEEAQRFRYTYIDTEHLLLALVRVADGVAAWVLRAQGVDLAALSAHVIGRMRHVTGPNEYIQSTASDPTPIVGLTPAGKRVIQQAVYEARRLGHPYLGTEHLLLGVLHESDGLGAQALAAFGVTLDSAREGVVAATALAMTPRTSPDDEPSTAFTRMVAGAGAAPGYLAVATPLNANAVDALDALVWAGFVPDRAAAAAWLVEAGLAAQQPFIAELRQRRASTTN